MVISDLARKVRLKSAVYVGIQPLLQMGGLVSCIESHYRQEMGHFNFIHHQEKRNFFTDKLAGEAKSVLELANALRIPLVTGTNTRLETFPKSTSKELVKVMVCYEFMDKASLTCWVRQNIKKVELYFDNIPITGTKVFERVKFQGNTMLYGTLMAELDSRLFKADEHKWERDINVTCFSQGIGGTCVLEMACLSNQYDSLVDACNQVHGLDSLVKNLRDYGINTGRQLPP